MILAYERARSWRASPPGAAEFAARSAGEMAHHRGGARPVGAPVARPVDRGVRPARTPSEPAPGQREVGVRT
ncbi:hypothetical protein [Nocardia brasiliensis]|uniref:hypothetical protein n=1 Tax=Nocardia brasiliensis TaxID=37326 RepID=UPI0024573805|nr:hypothetical protein [Nocardia brasiliensis]